MLGALKCLWKSNIGVFKTRQIRCLVEKNVLLCVEIQIIMVALEYYEDAVELMATGPKPEQIVSFKPSEKLQERARELIFKEKEGSIIPEEQHELDQILFFDHIMRLIKARARHYLSPQ